MRIGPLTVTLGKAAPLQQSPDNPVRMTSGVSWDAVRTTDLTALASRVMNEDLGPGVPIGPTHPEKTEPRLFDYSPGYNIAITPRTFEEIQFPALRQLSRSWDVAALCIQRNIDDLRQLRWEIRPKAVPGMDRDAVRNRRTRLEKTRASVEGFWMTPDQEQSWSSWLHEFFVSMYETDSACLYLQTTRDGSLYAVQNVDGTTIAPLIDERGRQPVPPEPAYRQIIRGLPWTFYMADLALPADERTLNFDRMHMIYEPFWGSSDSPYGHPPIEWVILTVQRALARQVLDYRLFNDGTTPYSFWKMPESWTEGQIASLQDAFDKLQGAPQQRARLRFMPGGTGAGKEDGFLEPKTEGEEFLLHVGCAAFNRSPMEMGFIRSAGGAGLGGKSVAQEQGKSGAKSIRAAALHLKALVDRITGLHFSPELEIVFPELEDTESAKERAEAEDLRIRNGSLGLDEARLDRDLDPIGPAGTGKTNLIFSGGGPPVLATSILANETPEPPPGGAKPPVPSAVPGQATDEVGALADEILGKGFAKAGPKYQRDLARMPHVAELMREFAVRPKKLTKGVKYKGNLAKIVHEYLLRSYPADDVAWTLDPAIDWEFDPDVPLDEINMARRPGGRNESKVTAIADTVKSGASLDPIVLADFGEPKLRIADGFHRTLGVEKAGDATIAAFVARDVPEQYRELVMGPMQDDSTSVKKVAFPPDPMDYVDVEGIERDRKLDLDRWLRKSLGAVKRGRSAAVPFESKVIPRETSEQLSAALRHAETPAAVRAMFEVIP